MSIGKWLTATTIITITLIIATITIITTLKKCRISQLQACKQHTRSVTAHMRPAVNGASFFLRGATMQMTLHLSASSAISCEQEKKAFPYGHTGRGNMTSCKPIRGLATVSLTTIVAACSTPYSSPSFESRPPGKTDFPGVAALVEAAPNHRVDVLMVHGMCTHGRDWADDAVKNLNFALGGTDQIKLDARPVEGTKAVLYQQTLTVPTGTIRASALVWSPIVAPLKHQLCFDQTKKSDSCVAGGFAKPAYPYERASLNAALKGGLLDDCLADAIIYQGKSRDAISEQIQKAIVTASSPSGDAGTPTDLFKAAASETTPLVLISESLGSKMALDAIYKLVTSPNADASAAGRQTFDRTTQIFMGANQMPILALADQSLEGVEVVRAGYPSYPSDPLAALIAIKSKRPSTLAVPAPHVIAFTDPNDLLSYILVPSKQVTSYDVVDVVVSNDNTYFGFLERPDNAHMGYRQNRTVFKLIACGKPSNGFCK
ncbi:MAG: hypothetical protein WBX11_12355 [Thiobacillaceae bacterium]